VKGDVQKRRRTAGAVCPSRPGWKRQEKRTRLEPAGRGEREGWRGLRKKKGSRWGSMVGENQQNSIGGGEKRGGVAGWKRKEKGTEMGVWRMGGRWVWQSRSERKGKRRVCDGGGWRRRWKCGGV
jgi:hypothetical protein